DHRCVLGARVLARAEDVEVAEHDRLEGLVHAREADAVALGGELRDSVGRDRIGEERLAHGKVGLRSVHRRRGGEDDAPNALVPGGEEDVQRSFDVHGARRQRVLDGARDRSERAEVIDDLPAADRVVYALVAAELSFDDVDVEAVEVRAVPRREVVEHADLVAALEQRAHEVRADEACASGDDRSCHQAAQPTPRVTAVPKANHVTASSGIPAMIPCAAQSPSTSTSQKPPRSAGNASLCGARNAVAKAAHTPAPKSATSSTRPMTPRSASVWT